MSHRVLIVGAGLSGLSAAWHCHKLGVDAVLVEARDRVGGRALTDVSEFGAFDLGPSWVWRGQPLVEKMLHHFRIQTHDQYCDGELLHQTPDGAVHRNPYLKPMQYAQRLVGGVGALVQSMADEVPKENLRLSAQLQKLSVTESGVEAQVLSEQGVRCVDADSVALAIPPRLIESIEFEPAIGAELLAYSQATPTWMASQAKFFAIYRQPFWRQQGLSGDAFSSTGILAEVHDACSADLAQALPREGAFYALFGFLRIDSQERKELGREAIANLAIRQLAEMFGGNACHPVHTILQDWSEEPYTASVSDAQPLLHHPNYRATPPAVESWKDRLHLISAETSTQDGGLIEGALQRGAQVAKYLL